MAASLERNLLLPSTNVDGLARAQDDPGFAFVVEESVVRLALRQPPCDLEAVPTGIYRRQYALAVRNGSLLRDSLNSAIVEMVDRGIYAKLVEKWWKENACSDGSRIVFISYSCSYSSHCFTCYQFVRKVKLKHVPASIEFSESYAMVNKYTQSLLEALRRSWSDIRRYPSAMFHFWHAMITICR